MKHWIAWLTLGACLLLFGCQETARQSTPPRRVPDQTAGHTKGVDFCRDMDLFYNESFALSPQEDVRLFHARIAGCRLHRTRLNARSLCTALTTAISRRAASPEEPILLAEAETSPGTRAVP
ncbi:MAG TPA: hypothetical protein ENN87_13510 [Phycisphaerales bacterium]|nr:hypothetical protein [Phycisphaerales bacterium]